MSGQSVYKPIYDNYASIHFHSLGWNCYIVNKRGWYCDLIGVRGNEIAIIEVKSPAEGSCGQNYNDVKGLTNSQLQSLPKNFRNWRRSIFNGIRNIQGLSLTKLFAISISCQLFRYLHEHNDKIEKYKKAIGNYIPQSGIFRLTPFFVVPIEGRQQADYALGYLKRCNYIFDYSTHSTCRLYVTKIEYHKTNIGFPP